MALKRPFGFAVAAIALLPAVACVEDAVNYYQAHHDAGVSAEPDASPGDAGQDGSVGGVDSGARDSGLGGTDAGPSDAGGNSDAGACRTDGGCTSDWEAFLRCGPVGQRLCPPTSLGFQGQASRVAVHGPADNFDVSAVAFAKGSTVWVGYGSDGGIFLTGSASFPAPIAALAVADGHDIDPSHSACADAFFSLSDGTGGYLVACSSLAPDAGSFAALYAPGSANAVSWLPQPGGAQNLALASAAPAFTQYWSESDIVSTSSPQPQWPAFAIQGLSGLPGWLWALPDGGLDSLHLNQLSEKAVATPVPLTPQSTAMTAADGGAAVVAASGGQLVGFLVDPSLTPGPTASLNANAATLGGLTRSGGAAEVFRVAFFDGAGALAVAELRVLPAPPTWTLLPVPAATAQAFAAPIDPHMLLMQDSVGNVTIGYLP